MHAVRLAMLARMDRAGVYSTQTGTKSLYVCARCSPRKVPTHSCRVNYARAPALCGPQPRRVYRIMPIERSIVRAQKLDRVLMQVLLGTPFHLRSI